MNWRRKKQNAHAVCAGEHREGKETASSLYSYPALTELTIWQRATLLHCGGTIFHRAKSGHSWWEHPGGRDKSRPYFLTTASASSFPGEKRTRSFSGTRISFRSRGFTPLRAALRRTLNEPKPTRRTSSPFWRDSRMASRVASSISAAFFWVTPAVAAMRLVISCRPTMLASVLLVFDVAIG